jgi:hypothetical protein
MTEEIRRDKRTDARPRPERVEFTTKRLYYTGLGGAAY